MISLILVALIAVTAFIIPFIILLRKEVRKQITVVLSTLISITSIVAVGGFATSFSKTMHTEAIKSWCRDKKYTYISHTKQELHYVRQPIFGVKYLVHVSEESDPILLQAGSWLTGSLGWDISG